MDWTQVKQVIELYDAYCEQLEQDEWDWAMDEDNTGIPFPGRPDSKDEIYKTVAYMYNKLNK